MQSLLTEFEILGFADQGGAQVRFGGRPSAHWAADGGHRTVQVYCQCTQTVHPHCTQGSHSCYTYMYVD